jgi:hypothetical protein
MTIKTILKLQKAFKALTPSSSLDDFYCFVLGFTCGDLDELLMPEPEFADWLKTRHRVSGTFNSFSVIALVCPSNEDDLSYYFSELKAYLKEKPASRTQRAKLLLNDSKDEMKKRVASILDILARKPGMLVHRHTATGLWYFLSGLETRLEEHGLTVHVDNFEGWLNKQYRSSSRCRWDRLLVSTIGDQWRAFYLALEWFNEYRSARANRTLKRPLLHIDLLTKSDLKILSMVQHWAAQGSLFQAHRAGMRREQK